MDPRIVPFQEKEDSDCDYSEVSEVSVDPSIVPFQEKKDPDCDYSEVRETRDSFHVVNRLPAPSAIMYRMEDLHKLIHTGDIDLDPQYQRKVVWSESKQMKLIDSLYHHYYIPPIIFTVFEMHDNEVRRCIDGKQRLTAIRKFIDGESILDLDPVTLRRFWFKTSRSNREEVPEPWKQDFLNMLITCVEYRGLPDSLERDIFQRVQLGVPLTAGEKLQAHTSPRADYITQLVSSFIISDVDMGIAEYVEFDTSRGRGFQAVAQMSYCCNNLPRQHFPSGRQLDEWLKKNEMPGDAFKGALEESLGMFKVIASTPGLNAGFKEVKNRVAPAEFVFIGILLYHMRGCDQARIADSILQMRKSVRAAFKDVRANGLVVKHLWEFINDKKPM
ncbi:hypothetical protein BC629DRAFT_1291594 [Irpex lacteus]|nr:hypothetical protein BC629DRAFT_1291594 [Irpex lacteus]